MNGTLNSPLAQVLLCWAAGLSAPVKARLLRVFAGDLHGGIRALIVLLVACPFVHSCARVVGRLSVQGCDTRSSSNTDESPGSEHDAEQVDTGSSCEGGTQ